MRLADDPTPADPLRDVRADVDRSIASVHVEIVLLADIHRRAQQRAGAASPESINREQTNA